MANYRRAQSKQNNRAAMLVVILLLVMMGIVGAVLVLLGPRPDPENIPAVQESGYIPVDKAAAEGPLPGLEIQREENFPEEEFHYLLNASPAFNKKGKKGCVYLENLNGNQGLMQVVYVLEESGEEVYQSPLLPPNWNVQTDDLDVQLEPGEYEAVAAVYVYESAEAENYIALFEEPIHITVG